MGIKTVLKKENALHMSLRHMQYYCCSLPRLFYFHLWAGRGDQHPSL